MDRKMVWIAILGVLVAGLIIAVVIVYGNGRQNRSEDIKDLVVQEKQYQNENSRILIEKDTDFLFRNSPKKENLLYADRAFRKAILNFETGQYREALNAFADIKVDSLDPELSAAAYYYMASCLVNMQEEKKAMLFLGRVIQNMKPNEWTTKCIILQGEINRKHQISDESLEVYLHKLHMETSDPVQRDEILTQLGYLKLFRENLDGAMEHFQRARNDLARLGEARVYVQKDMYWKAISIYEDMLQHKNFDNQRYFDDVKDAFQKQTYYYAKRWMDQGDLDHAYFYFRKIVNFFPNTLWGESSLYWLGEIFYTKKVWNSSLRYFNLVLSNGSNHKDAAAQFKKGMVYYNMRQYAQAIKNFQMVIDYHKDSAYLDRARQWINMSERELLYK